MAKIWLYVLSFPVFLLFSCDEDRAPCPCFTPNHYPIYLGCETLTVTDDVYDCSRNALLKQVYGAIKYPDAARQDTIEGRVIVKFEIGIDGHLSDYRATTQLGYGLEEAAIKGVMTLDSLGFCPAREECEVVPLTFTLPISFKLLG